MTISDESSLFAMRMYTRVLITILSVFLALLAFRSDLSAKDARYRFRTRRLTFFTTITCCLALGSLDSFDRAQVLFYLNRWHTVPKVLTFQVFFPLSSSLEIKVSALEESKLIFLIF